MHVPVVLALVQQGVREDVGRLYTSVSPSTFISRGVTTSSSPSESGYARWWAAAPTARPHT
jgi:hypothetical protein